MSVEESLDSSMSLSSCNKSLYNSLTYSVFTLSSSLPDDDTEYSVFDYYVDESGEWDVWQSKWVDPSIIRHTPCT